MNDKCSSKSQCKTVRCSCKKNNQPCGFNCKKCNCNSNICSNKSISIVNEFYLEKGKSSNASSKLYNHGYATIASEITKKMRDASKKNLSSIKDEVFNHRNHIDLYTKYSDEKIESPEVDHIIEYQMLGHASSRILHNVNYEPFINSLKDSINLDSFENYNVTEKSVNASKGSLIKKYLNDNLNRGYPLRSVIKLESPFGKCMNSIFETMNETYPIVVDYLQSDQCKRNDGHVTGGNKYNEIAEELIRMINEMDLNTDNPETKLRSRKN